MAGTGGVQVQVVLVPVVARVPAQVALVSARIGPVLAQAVQVAPVQVAQVRAWVARVPVLVEVAQATLAGLQAAVAILRSRKARLTEG